MGGRICRAFGNEAPDLVGISFSKMPHIVFYFFPIGIMGKKKCKKNPQKFVEILLWVMPEAVGITPNQPCLGFTLCKPLLL
jgi:hypothetical protein